MRTGTAMRQDAQVKARNKRALLRNLAHERVRAARYSYAWLMTHASPAARAYAEARMRRLEQEEARYA